MIKKRRQALFLCFKSELSALLENAPGLASRQGSSAKPKLSAH